MPASPFLEGFLHQPGGTGDVLDDEELDRLDAGRVHGGGCGPSTTTLSRPPSLAPYRT